MARDFDICQLCVKFQHCRLKSLGGDRTHRITDLVYIDDINCRKRRKKIIITRELCLRNLKHGILPLSGVLFIEKVVCIGLEHSKCQYYIVLHKKIFSVRCWSYWNGCIYTSWTVKVSVFFLNIIHRPCLHSNNQQYNVVRSTYDVSRALCLLGIR